jgi:hypothetical protein
MPIVEAPVLRLVEQVPEADTPGPATKRLTADEDGFSLHAPSQPHVHLIRYPGVLAPHHAWRSEIVLRRPEEEPSEGAAKPSGPNWADLLRRVLAVEVLICSFCVGQRRVIAEIEEGPIARKILAHPGLPATAPKPAQGSLFSTGPPFVDEREPSLQWSDEDDDQRLPDSDSFA